MNASFPKDAAQLAAARASLAGARDGHAVGPGPEADALRRAYLDLLKLALCDLSGPSTVSVSAREGGGVVSHELSGYLLRLRSAGMDWPLQGLTMTGLARLDDLQACVESVVADGVEGDLIEAGAWRGGSSILMKATLDALGAQREVVVADSFAGFPEVGDEGRPEGSLSTFAFLAVSEEEVRASFARFGLLDGVSLVRGLFEDTLPGLTDRRWAIARLDGDTYEATRVSLESLYPGLSDGGYLIVDDYGAYEECRKAVEEYRAEHGITAPIEAVDWTCVRWRKGHGGDGDGHGGAPAHGRSPRVATATGRPSALHTERELEFAEEAERLRARLAEAEDQVRRMRRTPLRRAVAKARRTLKERSS